MLLIPGLGRSAISALTQDSMYQAKPANAYLRCWRWFNRDDVTLDHLVKIREQSAIAEVEEPEHELKERAMTVLHFTEEFGLTEPGIGVFVDTDSEK
jgi:hypothetical protein